MKEIDYFLSQLIRTNDAEIFGFADVLMAMVVSTLLCFMLAHVYRTTHRGTSFSQSFILTLFMMGVCTSIVMMIIGSNIARAFSLVGALSIIRFRTAMKDPRDTGFLFAAMIAGMGCGTQFYMPAIALVSFICLLVLAIYYSDFGIKGDLEMIVRITFEENEETKEEVKAALAAAFKHIKMINRLVDFDDGSVTVVYTVKPGRKTDSSDVEKQLGSLKCVKRLSVYETDQHTNF